MFLKCSFGKDTLFTLYYKALLLSKVEVVSAYLASEKERFIRVLNTLPTLFDRKSLYSRICIHETAAAKLKPF